MNSSNESVAMTRNQGMFTLKPGCSVRSSRSLRMRSISASPRAFPPISPSPSRTNPPPDLARSDEPVLFPSFVMSPSCPCDVGPAGVDRFYASRIAWASSLSTSMT